MEPERRDAVSPFFGLYFPIFRFPGVPDDQLFARAATIAQTAEEAGFDAVLPMDHFHQLPGFGARNDQMLEAYVFLGALAARTERVQLGTLVSGVTHRNPALLGKMVTTLDVISGGRAICGIGAAWNEEEHRTYGFEFPPVKERMDRLEEALKILRAMFTQEAATFHGRYYHIENAPNEPRPLQPGGPPILVGGSGERRTLRLVAEYADICNVAGDLPTVRHKLDVLDRYCAEIGRNPATIVKTRHVGIIIGHTADEAEAKLAATVATLVRADPGVDVDAVRDQYLIGDVAGIAAQVRANLAIGLDGLTIKLPNAYELEPVTLVGEALAQAI